MRDRELLLTEIADTLQDIRLQLKRIVDRLDDAASMAAICGRNTPPQDDRQLCSASDPGRVPFGLSTHTPPLDRWRDERTNRATD